MRYTAHIPRAIEPLGPQYLSHARRMLRGRTWSEDERIQAELNVKSIEDEEVSEDEEEEDAAMLARDPKDWKNQDHYQVLGLSKYRYKATDEQIRRARRFYPSVSLSSAISSNVEYRPQKGTQTSP